MSSIKVISKTTTSITTCITGVSSGDGKTVEWFLNDKQVDWITLKADKNGEGGTFTFSDKEPKVPSLTPGTEYKISAIVHWNWGAGSGSAGSIIVRTEEIDPIFSSITKRVEDGGRQITVTNKGATVYGKPATQILYQLHESSTQKPIPTGKANQKLSFKNGSSVICYAEWKDYSFNKDYYFSFTLYNDNGDKISPWKLIKNFNVGEGSTIYPEITSTWSAPWDGSQNVTLKNKNGEIQDSPIIAFKYHLMQQVGTAPGKNDLEVSLTDSNKWISIESKSEYVCHAPWTSFHFNTTYYFSFEFKCKAGMTRSPQNLNKNFNIGTGDTIYPTFGKIWEANENKAITLYNKQGQIGDDPIVKLGYGVRELPGGVTIYSKNNIDFAYDYSTNTTKEVVCTIPMSELKYNVDYYFYFTFSCLNGTEESPWTGYIDKGQTKFNLGAGITKLPKISGPDEAQTGSYGIFIDFTGSLLYSQDIIKCELQIFEEDTGELIATKTRFPQDDVFCGIPLEKQKYNTKYVFKNFKFTNSKQQVYEDLTLEKKGTSPKKKRPPKFEWSAQKTTEGIFNLTAEEWLRLIANINDLRGYKDLQRISFNWVGKGHLISADLYNSMIDAIVGNSEKGVKALTSTPKKPLFRAKKGEIILAEKHLNNVRDTLNAIE